MKIKGQTLFTGMPSFNKLMALAMNVHLTYKLATVAQKLQPQLDAFNKARESLFRKYSPEGSNIEGGTPAAQLFQAEFSEFLDTYESEDIEMPEITEKSLGDSNLSAIDILTLVDFGFFQDLVLEEEKCEEK